MVEETVEDTKLPLHLFFAQDTWDIFITRNYQRRVGNMNIYVGNLSLDVTKEELRQEFMAFGEVKSVTIMNNKYIGSGQSGGYGFVEMPSLSEGQAAITALNGRILRHKTIDIIQALPLSDNSGNGSSSHKRGSKYSRNVRQRKS